MLAPPSRTSTIYWEVSPHDWRLSHSPIWYGTRQLPVDPQSYKKAHPHCIQVPRGGQPTHPFVRDVESLVLRSVLSNGVLNLRLVSELDAGDQLDLPPIPAEVSSSVAQLRCLWLMSLVAEKSAENRQSSCIRLLSSRRLANLSTLVLGEDMECSRELAEALLNLKW